MHGWTERMVLDCLVRRYGQRYGNGYRWAYAEHVRSGPGFIDGKRVADAVALDCWESKGLEIHGHEVKVARSDWLSELKSPEKAGAFQPYMNRWWLVIPDRTDIVRDDLPTGWGLMVARSDGTTKVVKRAPHRVALPMPVGMMATLMRATAATADRRVNVSPQAEPLDVPDTPSLDALDHGMLPGLLCDTNG